ncbi:hypothetical protein KUTeg_023130 [Tegillarca granosa]|uniref:Uncharacterized protein n=1 Tax=Tegillarca granosa TaxID=220873 RepID=A0ABQ9E6D6_TEGGR|nr:hypothetical protein KUTeg_023130 [Tegillarca granosa]
MAEQLSQSVLRFNEFLENKGFQTKEWMEYRPVNQLTEGAAIEFSIPSSSSSYVDLKNSRLYLKLKITQSDNTPIGESDNVALHSIFSQVDLQQQQQAVSSLGTVYPHKAILDVITNTSDTTQKRTLTSQLFHKDDA